MDKLKNLISKDRVSYWKSLNDREQPDSVKGLKQNEFMSEPAHYQDIVPQSGISRRKFIALTAATGALLATACSDYRDKGEIVAYNQKPENLLPGEADYYASTCTGCVLNCGILIKTREGRPIKIDGNPSHPINQGKMCSAGQASIMNLYSPERLQNPLKRRGGELILFRDELKQFKWNDADKEIIDLLKNASNEGKTVALISGQINSPTQAKLIDEFIAKYPTVKHYSYELINESTRTKALKLAYGSEIEPNIKWDKAKVILLFEADILGNEGNFIENIRLFTQNRNVNNIDNFNRLYSIEAKMSLTGMNADYRMRLNPVYQFDFLMALINEIVNVRGFSKIPLHSDIINRISKFNLKSIITGNEMDARKVAHLVDDLIENAGSSIVYAGNTQSLAVHSAVLILNEILGNTGLYDYENHNIVTKPLSNDSEIEQLVSDMINGKVDTVIHFDTNPVFDLPKEFGYLSALKKVKNIISLTETDNETSVHSNYILPIHHNFESWGDSIVRSGIISLQQPVINPLYNTRQKEAVLLRWTEGIGSSYSHDLYHKYLRNYWETEVYVKSGAASDFNTFWFASLHDGFANIAKAELKITLGNINKDILTVLNPLQTSGFTLLLSNNYTIMANGKFANNGWLQELPHPVTKATWDNYAMIAPKTARELGLDFDDLINLKVGKDQITLPVILQPGLSEKFIAVELGYGRTKAGEIGNNVGVNVNQLISTKSNLSKFIFTGVTAEKAPGRYKIASTQEHHMLDDMSIKDIHKERHIIQEGTVENYKSNPNFMQESKHEDLISMYPPYKYDKVKWAMSIDMNKCIGCGLCVTSCNVENNIPIVGKDQTMRGREMQWMRIDRYYSGTTEDPEVSNQPMLCQHCDNAPCEKVCPVVATNHSPDGLNQMVYNRCVGTRYCSNNCPYKVRRYNYLDYRDVVASSYQKSDSLELMHNPEVTIRARGVMEKCTFCVQRIMEARQEATKEGRKIKGTDVQTACQQACPSNAIVFGDMNDKASLLSEYRNHKLGYHVLEELNVKPNVTYIARLRNKKVEDK